MAVEHAEAKYVRFRPVFFVVSTDMDGAVWRMMAVKAGSTNLTAFKTRIYFQDEWRGLADGNLSKVAAIENCVIFHRSGHTGGHETLAGALQMVRKTIDMVGVGSS